MVGYLPSPAIRMLQNDFGLQIKDIHMQKKLQPFRANDLMHVGVIIAYRLISSLSVYFLVVYFIS